MENYREKYIAITKALLLMRSRVPEFPEALEDLIADHLEYLWRKCLTPEDIEYINAYDFSGPG
jgi:hypothetical protein